MADYNPYKDYSYKNAYDDGMEKDIIDGYDEPYEDSGANIIDLNSILVRAFIFMVIALGVTAFVAMYVASDMNMVIRLYSGYNYIILIVVEFAMVFLTQYAVNKKNLPLAIIGFFGYSVATGIMFSVIFVVFEIGSIANAFFITAALFLLMAVYGIITKRDMDQIGDYAIMALLGIIVVSFLNMFVFKSSGLDWIVSAVTVVIFVCLTAYDTWKLKKMSALKGADKETKLVLGVYGAMELYLDFINIFLKILRFVGRARD